MSEIIFYTNVQSRGVIIQWMLEELGEPYETKLIAYGEEMKGPEYLAINPMGKVPAITHHGNVVTECAAICTYLAASYPEKGLIPHVGKAALADFYRWMFFAAGPMETAVTSKALGWEVTDEQRATAGFGSHSDTMNALEIALSNGPYVCGDQFTAVDVYLGSGLTWGLMFNTVEKRDCFVEYTERLAARPAAIRAQDIIAKQGS